jgi:hypothetical protein
MPSLDSNEVRAVPSQLVPAGAATEGTLSATRFLSAMDNDGGAKRAIVRRPRSPG